MTRRPTLRRRLTVVTATAAATAVIGLSVAAWLLLRMELRGQLDRALREDGPRAAARFDPTQLASLPAWAQPDAAPLFGVVYPDGSRRRPQFQTVWLPVSGVDIAVAIGRRHDVLRDVTVDGTDYRMLTLHSARGDAVQVARDLSAIDATVDRFAVLLAVADVVVVGAAAVVGYALTRAGLRPVDRVRWAAEHVARTQDLHAAVPVSPSDPAEVSSVAASVNAILTALGVAREAQQQLVADAGHELATPLTSLRTNIDLLLRAASHPERQLAPGDRARLLHDIKAQTSELSHLIDEVLELAQDSGSAEETVPLDFAEVVGNALARARTRTSEVQFALTERPAPTVGRPAALERAVLNLLDNAAKWSPPGTPVEVSVGPTGQGPHLVVADRGPGVRAADRQRVFERFFRAADARSTPGSGLGLAIVFQVVTSSGGRTWLAERPGGGTEAHIQLPVAPGFPAGQHS